MTQPEAGQPFEPTDPVDQSEAVDQAGPAGQSSGDESPFRDQTETSQAGPEPESEPSAPPPPSTGDPSVDGAIEGLDRLEDRPLDQHHDQLARAHETLHRALHPDQFDQTEPDQS